VLLIDDVLTTRATRDACVRALSKAGAGQVWILCFTRVLDEAIDTAWDRQSFGRANTTEPARQPA
jgi:adenine/guanine phosphoribosyltransferase-like PRPP-binding protein